MKRKYLAAAACCLLLCSCTVSKAEIPYEQQDLMNDAVTAYLESWKTGACPEDFHAFYTFDLEYLFADYIPVFDILSLDYSLTVEKLWNERLQPFILGEYEIDPESWREEPDGSRTVSVLADILDLPMMNAAEVLYRVNRIALADINNWEKRTDVYLPDIPEEDREEFYYASYSGAVNAISPLLEQELKALPHTPQILNIHLICDSGVWKAESVQCEIIKAMRAAMN